MTNEETNPLKDFSLDSPTQQQITKAILDEGSTLEEGNQHIIDLCFDTLKESMGAIMEVGRPIWLRALYESTQNLKKAAEKGNLTDIAHYSFSVRSLQSFFRYTDEQIRISKEAMKENPVLFSMIDTIQRNQEQNDEEDQEGEEDAGNTPA